MNRRNFLEVSGTFAATMLVSPAMALDKKTWPLGLQLYSIREALSRDVPGTLKKIAGYGYRELEIYGFDGKFYGYEPRVFKTMLGDLGMRSPSGHFNLDKYFHPESGNEKLLEYVDLCITGAHALGQQYIVWPWVAENMRDMETFRKLVEQLNIIGERVTAAGLKFAYHNHDFEFADHDGTKPYDLLLQRTDASKVKLELDLYWASYMKQDVPALVNKHAGRFELWHLKDKDRTDPLLHTYMGNGDIDFSSLMPYAKAAGVKHMYVEQGNNYVPDDLECVKRSAEYVKKNLLKG